MNRFTITFFVGIIGLCSIVGCHRSPEAAVLPNEFVLTGSVSGFKVAYRRSSDGVIVRYHCSDRASAKTALALVRNKRDAPLVEQTDVFDGRGSKIGERRVWDAPGNSYDAEIVWNNDARLFAVHAQSLTDALNFEASRAWVGGPCWNARSW
jgi:hypothetical protein